MKEIFGCKISETKFSFLKYPSFNNFTYLIILDNFFSKFFFGKFLLNLYFINLIILFSICFSFSFSTLEALIEK